MRKRIRQLIDKRYNADAIAKLTNNQRSVVFFVLAKRIGLIYIDETKRGVHRRLREMGLISPDELQLLGHSNKFSLENLHRTFHASHHHGNWFEITPNIREYLTQSFKVKRVDWDSKDPVLQQEIEDWLNDLIGKEIK